MTITWFFEHYKTSYGNSGFCLYSVKMVLSVNSVDTKSIWIETQPSTSALYRKEPQTYDSGTSPHRKESLLARTNNAPQEQLPPTHQPQLPAPAHPKVPFNQTPFQNEHKSTIKHSHYSLQVHSGMEFIIPSSPYAASSKQNLWNFISRHCHDHWLKIIKVHKNISGIQKFGISCMQPAHKSPGDRVTWN